VLKHLCSKAKKRNFQVKNSPNTASQEKHLHLRKRLNPLTINDFGITLDYIMR